MAEETKEIQKEEKTAKSSDKIKRFKGMVVSDKMDKTVVVDVVRYVKHPIYRKYRRINKRFKAHDEKKEYKKGDKVIIEETKPLSKDKHFKVISKV
jgi:small subunit ribosomal protein S17